MNTFRIVSALIILGFNLAYVALIVWLLRRCGTAWQRPLIQFTVAWSGILSFFVMASFLILPQAHLWYLSWLYFPLALQMIWNALVVVAVLPGLIGLTLLVRLYLWRRPSPALPAPASAGPGLSRRRFLGLAVAGFAPAGTTLLAVHGIASRNDLRVREFTLLCVGLAPELEGYTLVHVSDLHSGIFVGPHRLRLISEAVNDHRPDLIAVTGDLINREAFEFGNVQTALRAMHARDGLYICEGNHDVLAGDGFLEAACRESGLPYLADRAITIARGAGRLHLAGLPWVELGFGPVDPARIARLYPERQPGDVRVLLTHHPHIFDSALASDLVLTGHTHGGQLMLGPFGVGSFLFRYWSGAYRVGGRQLIVSNGCGDWFPCRIGAPAEIGLIRLTRA